jgi:hypothetical protein
MQLIPFYFSLFEYSNLFLKYLYSPTNNDWMYKYVNFKFFTLDKINIMQNVWSNGLNNIFTSSLPNYRHLLYMEKHWVKNIILIKENNSIICYIGKT